MSDTITLFSEKRYNDFRKTVISDCLDIVLNTVANQTVIDNKDKTFTVKKLSTTVELVLKLLGELNSEQIPSDIVKSIKPRISTTLNNVFCYKQPVKNTNNENNKKEDIIENILFTPYIQTAVEIAYKEIKSDTLNLSDSFEHFHFFALPLNIDERNYIVIYAEKNKYSKREIVEVLIDNVIVDKNIITSEIKNKYNLF